MEGVPEKEASQWLYMRLHGSTFIPVQPNTELIKLFSVCFDCSEEIPSRRHVLRCTLNQAGAFPVFLFH